jgi:protein O-GlcNAc transferase
MQGRKAMTPVQINPLLQKALHCYQQGRLPEAGRLAQRILVHNPNHEKAAYLLGLVMGRQGQHESAARLFGRALRSNPRQPEYHYNLGFSLHSCGRLDQALAEYQQAIQLNPEYVEAHNKCGDVFRKLGRPEQALSAYEVTIKLNPRHPVAYNNRGVVLYELGYLWQALESYERMIHINSRSALAWNNSANVLMYLGRLAEAEENYRQALRLRPDYAEAHSNLLFLLAAQAILPPDKMYDEQRHWDRVHGRRGREFGRARQAHPPRPERRLRVGYVSTNMRKHVVSYFIEPLFAAHDRTRFEIFCYASHPPSLSDATTEHLRSMVEHWRFVYELGDEQLASLVVKDGIDILVDLSGHTAKNRLKVFTYRAAPVQATYLGYFSGTGLQAMDYWITDDVLHPPDTAERSVETIYRLPRCWVSYKPPAEAPEVAPCPSVDADVVFGSFSNVSKLTPEVIDTWSALLRLLPGSRLLLMAKQLIEQRTRKALLQQFERRGIAGDRLLMREGAALRTYLAAYAEVDIVLDPFPRTGGTTTAESLWMGVPVVTLAGRCYAERISASKLMAVGLQDLISSTTQEYIATALSLAHDPGRRIDLRANLRERMLASALCDGNGLARSIESAYLSMIRTATIPERV